VLDPVHGIHPILRRAAQQARLRGWRPLRTPRTSNAPSVRPGANAPRASRTRLLNNLTMYRPLSAAVHATPLGGPVR
jgi:hypothetical protein